MTTEPLLCEQRVERHAGAERAGEVDVEHLDEGLDLVFLVAHEDPGAVDQRIGAPVRPGKGLDGIVVRDVEGPEPKACARLEPRARQIGVTGGRCRHRRA